MITTIDKAGRVVVPKKIRDAMGLKPGTPIDIVYEDGRVVIEYAMPEVQVDRSGSIPVLRRLGGSELPPLTDEIVRETLEAVRDEGLQHYL